MGKAKNNKFDDEEDFDEEYEEYEEYDSDRDEKSPGNKYLYEKAYAILYDYEYIFFPVKALIDPYKPSKKSYLANMPNFFGGNVEITEIKNHQIALEREIKEESQLQIIIPNSPKIPFSEIHYAKLSDSVEYFFYFYRYKPEISFSEGQNGISIFHLSSNLRKGNEKYNEQQAIVRININHLLHLKAHESSSASPPSSPSSSETVTKAPPTRTLPHPPHASPPSAAPPSAPFISEQAKDITARLVFDLGKIFTQVKEGICDWNNSQTKIAFEIFIQSLLKHE